MTTTLTRPVTVAAGVFAPGHLSELTRYLPVELVDDVLAQTRTLQRRIRALPSRTGVYFVLALGLFPGLGYARVWAKLVAGLTAVGVVVPVVSEKAQRDLRRRLGPAPLKALFEVVAGPLAQPRTPGPVSPGCARSPSTSAGTPAATLPADAPPTVRGSSADVAAPSHRERATAVRDVRRTRCRHRRGAWHVRRAADTTTTGASRAVRRRKPVAVVAARHRTGTRALPPDRECGLARGPGLRGLRMNGVEVAVQGLDGVRTKLDDHEEKQDHVVRQGLEVTAARA